MGRELKPGEVSLDDLEAAFLNAEGPDLSLPPEKPAQEPEKASANQVADKKRKSNG